MPGLTISPIRRDEVSTGGVKALPQQVVALDAEGLMVAEGALDFAAGLVSNAMHFGKDGRDGGVHSRLLPALAAAVG
jgi:hypothetical protein